MIYWFNRCIVSRFNIRAYKNVTETKEKAENAILEVEKEVRSLSPEERRKFEKEAYDSRAKIQKLEGDLKIKQEDNNRLSEMKYWVKFGIMRVMMKNTTFATNIINLLEIKKSF